MPNMFREDSACTTLLYRQGAAYTVQISRNNYAHMNLTEILPYLYLILKFCLSKHVKETSLPFSYLYVFALSLPFLDL